MWGSHQPDSFMITHLLGSITLDNQSPLTESVTVPSPPLHLNTWNPALQNSMEMNVIPFEYKAKRDEFCQANVEIDPDYDIPTEKPIVGQSCSRPG